METGLQGTHSPFRGYNDFSSIQTGNTKMSNGNARKITNENIGYFLKYMRKKLASSDALEEVFKNPDDTQKLSRDLTKFESKADLKAINKWFLEEVTSTGQQRFWTAHRSIKWTRKNPARDRIVISSLARVIRGHTGIEDLNEAIASLLPKELVKPSKKELAEIKKNRLNK